MKVYFYTTDIDSWNDLESSGDLMSQTRGLQCWIHMTTYYLRKYSKIIEPIVVNQVPEEGIIVFHKGYFPKLYKPGRNQFFVCIQADYGRHRYAQMHLVQNPLQLQGFNGGFQSAIDPVFSFTKRQFLPLWPQPSIIERNPDRKYAVEHVGFFGNPQEFLSDEIGKFETFLKGNGLNIRYKFDPADWADYSTTDIALAIRSFSNLPYYNKPVSKLVNAVLAGSLIVAGDESSSRFFKKRYFPEMHLVATLDDTQRAIKQLLDDPVSAFEKVSNCRARLEEFSIENLTYSWEQLLLEAEGKFKKWKKMNSMKHRAFLLLRSK